MRGVLPGRVVLLIAAKAMHVFDTATGGVDQVRSLGKQRPRTRLGISPDNQDPLLVGWGYGEEYSTADGKTPPRNSIHRVQLRKLSDGKLAGEFSRQDDGSSAAAFSPDSRRRHQRRQRGTACRTG